MNSRPPNNNEIAEIVRETREKDLQEISTPEVKAAQLAATDAEEAQTLEISMRVHSCVALMQIGGRRPGHC